MCTCNIYDVFVDVCVHLIFMNVYVYVCNDTCLHPSFQVSLMIRRDLTQRAQDFNIILDDCSITELSFGREYASAVESKQVG